MSQAFFFLWYIHKLSHGSDLFRPPDIVVGGLRFYRDSFSSFYLLLFSSSTFELSEQNSTNTGHMLGIKRDLKMHVRNLGHTLPLKSGAQKPHFWRSRNLLAILTVYIFRVKQDVHNRVSALETTRGFLHRLRISWTLVNKWLKIGPAFLPTLRKFCILLYCQAYFRWRR